MSATPIEISVGGSRWASSWAQDLMTWEDFTESLSARMYNNASTETHAEYMALSKAEQDKRKDVGGFVGGKLFKKMPSAWLRRLFGVFLLYGGVRYLL